MAKPERPVLPHRNRDFGDEQPEEPRVPKTTPHLPLRLLREYDDQGGPPYPRGR